MPEIADQQVHLIVTSPPYWSIKDYGHDEQIGTGETHEQYLQSLASVIGEAYRVLHGGCRMVVNIGDQFCSAQEHEVYHIKPLSADIIQIGLKQGFFFMGDILWKKVPSGEASGGTKLAGSLYYPRDGALNLPFEHILVFKKLGQKPAINKDQLEPSKLSHNERVKWFTACWDDVPPEKQVGHVAMFPVELPTRIIKMFSYHGETVLDPFMGSGTTAKAAMQTGRNSVGYEINQDLQPMIQEKVVGSMPELWDDVLEFETR